MTRAPPHPAEPASFRSRGLAVPFTTARLAAAHVREAPRGGLELVLPDPTGHAGRYVVPWTDAETACTPTVHDTMLMRSLSRMGALSPRTVRDSALAVAVQGYAGEDATKAAKAALAMDRQARAAVHAHLLASLIERVDPGHPAPANQRSPAFEQRLGMVLAALAPLLRRPPPQLAAALGGLAETFGPIGLRPEHRTARLVRLICLIEDVHAELQAWLRERAGHDVGGLGSAVEDALSAAAKTGASALRAIRKAASDPLALLRQRLTDAGPVADFAERGFWLLDGMEGVCLTWRAAHDTASRRLALLDMAQRLPHLPADVRDWADPTIEVFEPAQHCRVVHRDGLDQSPAAAHLATWRNETLRAMSL